MNEDPGQPTQGDDPLNPWRSMDRAPKNATWIDVKIEKTQQVFRAHWAQDLSGECQPAFRGWFVKAGPRANTQIPDPYAWRPIRP